MAGEPCRGCDGRGSRTVLDKLNVLKSGVETKCSRCQGSGCEPGPPTGKGGFRRAPKPKLDADELSLEQQADAFLGRRGFSKGGR
jgi:hypothetical protein